MKLREHRGGLAESMETVIDIPPTLEALKIAINNAFSEYDVPEITADMITVKPYGFDERIGWDTHIVIIADCSVYGFTDGPLSQLTDENNP